MASTKRVRPIYYAVVLTFVCFFKTSAQEKEPLRMGFLDYAFNAASIQDTKVAVNLYIQKLLEDTRYQSQTVVFQNIEDLRQALKNETIEMASVSGIDFLRLQPDSLVIPISIRTYEDDTILDAYTLLVHKDQGWSSLADLRNKHVRFPPKETLIEMWLDVALAENNLPKATVFFGTVTKDPRPSQSVLSVFFKQADACIVTTRTYNTISQLNPQISQSLVSIAQSPEYLPGMLCFHTKLASEDQEILRQATFNFDNSEEGRQVLKLFKTKQILPFEQIYLKTILELMAKHQKHYGNP